VVYEGYGEFQALKKPVRKAEVVSSILTVGLFYAPNYTSTPLALSLSQGD